MIHTSFICFCFSFFIKCRKRITNIPGTACYKLSEILCWRRRKRWMDFCRGISVLAHSHHDNRWNLFHDEHKRHSTFVSFSINTFIFVFRLRIRKYCAGNETRENSNNSLCHCGNAIISSLLVQHRSILSHCLNFAYFIPITSLHLFFSRRYFG